MMSAVQGGAGFHFIAPHVYAYLSAGQWSDVQVPLEDIPEGELKVLLNKV